MEAALKTLLHTVSSPDQSLLQQARNHLDNLTKPRGSLGRLEDLAARIYTLQDGNAPQVDPAVIFTCAADHGVVQEGVSLYPQEVTRQMVLNFLSGGAAINVLSATAGMKLKVVDVGCMGGSFPDHPDLIQNKIRPGTANLAREPAMTRDDCLRAVMLGVTLAQEAADQGFTTIGTGEMGIGNTTPATAMYSALLHIKPAAITGPGTGLDYNGIRHKEDIIDTALNTHRNIISRNNVLDIMAALGGLEIACLTGIVLGAAARKRIILVDGFISTAAYVAAWKLCPEVAHYSFLSHCSAEPGHRKIMNTIAADPLLDLNMRLGEGTGAALAHMLLRSSVNIFNDMASFEQAGVSRT